MAIKYYESPFHATEPKEEADRICAVVDKVIDITRNMEPLGEECQKVLNDNLWDLYES